MTFIAGDPVRLIQTRVSKAGGQSTTFAQGSVGRVCKTYGTGFCCDCNSRLSVCAFVKISSRPPKSPLRTVRMTAAVAAREDETREHHSLGDSFLNSSASRETHA